MKPWRWLPLFLMAAGCSTALTDTNRPNHIIIALAVSDRLLLELTLPDGSQYEYGVVNLAGGGGMRIPARDMSSVPAMQIGVFIWADIADRLAEESIDSLALPIKIPTYEIFQNTCPALSRAVGAFRLAVDKYMVNSQDETYKAEPPDYYKVDGTSFLIQFQMPDGRVILNPGPYSRLHETTSALQRAISGCYKGIQPKYISHDF